MSLLCVLNSTVGIWGSKSKSLNYFKGQKMNSFLLSIDLTHTYELLKFYFNYYKIRKSSANIQQDTAAENTTICN